jgi:hypothetical protein
MLIIIMWDLPKADNAYHSGIIVSRHGISISYLDPDEKRALHGESGGFTRKNEMIFHALIAGRYPCLI